MPRIVRASQSFTKNFQNLEALDKMDSWKVPCGLSQLEMQLFKLICEKESALAVSLSQRLSTKKDTSRVPASQENQVVPHLGPEQELFHVGLPCLRLLCTLSEITTRNAGVEWLSGCIHGALLAQQQPCVCVGIQSITWTVAVQGMFCISSAP